MREMFEKMLAEAESAFDRGELTVALPISFEWQPKDWSAREVAWARVLARSPEADAGGREFAHENGYPVEPGRTPRHRPEDAAAFEAWLAPLELLLESAPRIPANARPDFYLSTLVNGWCAWDAEYTAVPLTDRVGVLTVQGLGDLYPPFPMPWCLVDRARLLPAVAEGLGDVVDWFGTSFADIHCSHTAAELYRVLLVASGLAGSDAWELDDAELASHRVPAASWSYDDLRQALGDVAGKEG